MLLLYFPFKNEKELLSGFPPFYQNKLEEQVFQDVVNINKLKFEPYCNLVDETFTEAFNFNLMGTK